MSPELREPDLPRTAKVTEARRCVPGGPPAPARGGGEGGQHRAAHAAKSGQTSTLRLPGGGRVTLPVCACEVARGRAEAVVVKDAGDDPDVTHGAH